MPNERAREFFRTKPRVIYFRTVEFFHPQGILRRFVQNQYQAQSFTLESNAPRNAGETVSFEPAAAEIKEVQQSNQTTVSLEIQLGRVGQMLKTELKKINGTGNLTPIEVIFRVYTSDDRTAPLVTPITLFASSANIENENVALIAEDDNPASVTVSNLYLAQDFGGLEVQLG